MAFKYTITQKFIPDIPKIPYALGVDGYIGACGHATAVYSDTADGERSYEVAHWQEAFVHGFADSTTLLQTAPFEYSSWGAGANANPKYVHIEMCQVKNDGTAAARTKFDATFDRWTFMLAYVVYRNPRTRAKGVVDGDTLVSHQWVTQNLGGTTHTDPIGYLAEWGMTWADVVYRVSQHFAALNTPPAYRASAADIGKAIAFMGAGFTALDGFVADQAEFHRLADELRKVSGQLQVDEYYWLSQEDANKILPFLGDGWKVCLTGGAQNEMHRVAEEVRKTANMPLAA